MRIIKILNHNTALVVDGEEEKVAMGRGIAFGKKQGERLDIELAEKVYSLTGKGSDSLLASLDPRLLDISHKTLAYAEEQLEAKLSDLSFVAIADHLSAALSRDQAELEVKNFLLWDIKRLFSRQFEVGRFALDLVEETFGVRLAEDEAGFVALHVINSSQTADASKLTKLMEEILTLIRFSLNQTFDEEDIYFQRFMTHLSFFAERILSQSGSRSDRADDDMLEMIRAKYPEAYAVSERLADYIESQYDYRPARDELLYLSIHLTRLIN
ncbi:PRD domain-containing protein [Lactococcus termiticola]|uniref:Transcriptional antiterminator n=1 Tax=Lactococcus termiticola TaxID=2169526 RepID=A0A2R5HK21_9LACT|nr:PRD domain-containing protein [Lactococcus termiticola]GBG97068.1 transcriptional antiterminator [Lactococcus termiticola]